MAYLPIWDASASSAQAFCRDLAERLEGGEHVVPGLSATRAVDRADPLFDAVADLADCVVSHAAGRVDVGTVRSEALRVATLACRLWLVSLELTVQNEAEACPERSRREAGDGDD